MGAANGVAPHQAPLRFGRAAHLGNQVQDRLVVCKVDVAPGKAFALILVLLDLEHLVHEKLLQSLVGKIDAQLLQAVGRHVFKSKNVQHEII